MKSVFLNWQTRVLKGWNFVRIIRFGLAVVVLTESVKNSDLLLASMGIILFYQSVFNVGCCSTFGCGLKEPFTKTNSTVGKTEEIIYTEVK